MMYDKTTQPQAETAFISGCVLLLIPFFALLISSAAFAMQGCIAPWMFPAACLAALAYGHVEIRRTSSDASHPLLRYYLTIIATLLFAIVSAALIYDNSTDGNYYHQGAIIALLEGWNPFAGSEGIDSLWIKHYAKAIEIVAATIASCTGRIEAGKAVNVMLAFSSALVAYSFLRTTFRRLTTTKAIVLTCLLTLCPTVLRQMYVYYIDYAMYTFMLMTVISLMRLSRKSGDRVSWIVITAATLFAAGVKFNIAFYQYLTLAIGTIWLYIAGQRALACKLAGTSLLLLIGGMCLLGYHPYITNLIGWGNPFYPLIGSTVDIMTENTPELYADGNRFTNWLRSLFYTYDGTAVWCPFATDSLRDYVIGFDRRITGFSPFFVYVLIGSVALLASCRKAISKAHLRTCCTIAVLLTAACFVFEQSWWMRYVPFLWGVPLSLLLCTEHAGLKGWRRAFRTTLYALMGLTLLLTAGSAAIGGMTLTTRLNGVYKAVTPESTVKMYVGGMTSFRHKLQERGIRYEEIPSDNYCEGDPALRKLPLQDEVTFYLDSATYSRIERPDLMDYVVGKKAE